MLKVRGIEKHRPVKISKDWKRIKELKKKQNPDIEHVKIKLHLRHILTIVTAFARSKALEYVAGKEKKSISIWIWATIILLLIIVIIFLLK